jgi:hypothetical protein
MDVDDVTKAYTARRITAFAARRIATMHTGNIRGGDHIKVGAFYSCSNCKKTGHKAEKCWEKNPELRPKTSTKKTSTASTPQKRTAYMARSGPPGNATQVGALDWALDTAASDHMARTRECFDAGSYKAIRAKVQVANGQYMDVIGQGTITLDVLLFGREPAQVKLLEVLHTPDVPHNLISYTRMMSTGKFKSKDNERHGRPPQGRWCGGFDN